jgi:hypothetical protein
MADWHYTSGGSQHGPVSDEQFKSLVASGTIRPSDLVWNPTLPQWVPAGQAGAVIPAPASAPTPGYSAVPAQPVAGAVPTAGQYGALAYEAPSAESIPFTHQSFELLRQTRPWVLFIGILFLIFAGFCVIGGLSMLAMVFAMPRAGVGVPKWLPLMYVVMAAFYIVPAVPMVRFASRVKRLARMRRVVDLEDTLSAMKNIFRVSGILIIVVIAAYIAVIGGVLVYHLK